MTTTAAAELILKAAAKAEKHNLACCDIPIFEAELQRVRQGELFESEDGK